MTIAATNVFPISELVGYVRGIFNQFAGQEEEEAASVLPNKDKGRGISPWRGSVFPVLSGLPAGCS